MVVIFAWLRNSPALVGFCRPSTQAYFSETSTYYFFGIQVWTPSDQGMEFPTYGCWHCFFHSTMQSNWHSLVMGCRLAGACAIWAVKLRFESWTLRFAWGPKARLLSHLQSQEHHPGYRISKSFHMVVLFCSGLGWLACGLELCSPVSPRVLPRTFLPNV